MSKIKFLISLFLFIAIATQGVSEEKFHIATDEWRPYQSKYLKHYGVISRIITEAFGLEGVNVEWHWRPWKRVLKETEVGKWDGASLSLKNAERAKIFYYPDPLFIGKRYFFHRKDYPFNWNNLDDLKGIRIVAIGGYNYGELFENAEQSGKIEVYRVTKIKQAFQMLQKGRIKIYPILQDVGYDLIQTYFKSEEVKNFTHHPKVVHETAFYLIMSKKVERNTRMLLIFNRGLERLKKSGKFDQYMAESLRGEYRKNK